MENPILQMLNQKQLSNQSGNNLFNMLQNANNPQELMRNLINQNPQIMGLVNQYGNGDPKTAFYALAQQSGRDPEQILSMLRKFM
jgi:hypothetical protein